MRKELSQVLDYYLFNPIKDTETIAIEPLNAKALNKLFLDRFTLAIDFKPNLISGCLESLPLKYLLL